MLEHLRRRSSPPRTCSASSRTCATAGVLKLALRGAVPCWRVAVGAVRARRLRDGDGEVHDRVDRRGAHRSARLVLAAALCFFVVRPLRRQVTDEQVALYLEEHEPSLQATLLSAVEASRSGDSGGVGGAGAEVVEQAIEACARWTRRAAPTRRR